MSDERAEVASVWTLKDDVTEVISKVSGKSLSQLAKMGGAAAAAGAGYLALTKAARLARETAEAAINHYAESTGHAERMAEAQSVLADEAGRASDALLELAGMDTAFLALEGSMQGTAFWVGKFADGLENIGKWWEKTPDGLKAFLTGYLGGFNPFRQAQQIGETLADEELDRQLREDVGTGADPSDAQMAKWRKEAAEAEERAAAARQKAIEKAEERIAKLDELLSRSELLSQQWVDNFFDEETARKAGEEWARYQLEGQIAVMDAEGEARRQARKEAAEGRIHERNDPEQKLSRANELAADLGVTLINGLGAANEGAEALERTLIRMSQQLAAQQIPGPAGPIVGAFIGAFGSFLSAGNDPRSQVQTRGLSAGLGMNARRGF